MFIHRLVDIYLSSVCVCFSTQAHTRRVFLEAIPIFIQIWSFFSSFELYNKNAVHKQISSLYFLLSCAILLLFSRRRHYLTSEFSCSFLQKEVENIYKEPEFYLVILLKITQKMDMYSLTDKEKEIYREEKTVPH